MAHSRKHLRKVWEQIGPAMGAVFAVVVIWVSNTYIPWGIDIGFPTKTDALLGASVTFGALFATLLATTLSFLSGVDTRVAKLVRESSHNNDLLVYFRAAIRAATGLSLFSLMGYLIDGPNQEWYFYIWLFFVIFTIRAFWRSTDILILILWRDPD